MFRLFRRKGKEKVSMDLPVRNYGYKSNNTCADQEEPVIHVDSKMARLMELIGSAIEVWATEYQLENLPKKIIFEQALDAMRAIELAMNSREN